MAHSSKAHARTLVSLLPLGVATLVVLTPFIWMVSLAFTSADQAFSASNLIPESPTTANFVTALTSGGLGRAMLNSSAVAVIVVVSNCLFASMAGYAFAKLRFRGDTIVFAVLISTAMIPVSVTLIPLFLITKGIPLAGGNDILGVGGYGLLNSIGGLALPYLVTPLNIFLSRQYFLEFPDELAEAARTDGAGELRIFFQIYLPLAKPLIATLGVFAFTGIWDDFLWPLVITNTDSMNTVQLALAKFLTSGNVQYGPVLAGAVLVTVPVLVVFAFNQRAFISGLADGGIKG
ncbi:carbohydrate ABC transporter permease [Kribbella pittospori]|uniref:Carbohydrate ABC transporter permease n=1 Tax=Kribbella pittospori TaxID=722689 RepID=A0A4R0KLF1_9ACTN|nr:carbohydrate ABC transporter permease [Kribbella pittospori]TCC61119.1 carbohydrate ABC transporter permease [Kribbella pittospori]